MSGGGGSGTCFFTNTNYEIDYIKKGNIIIFLQPHKCYHFLGLTCLRRAAVMYLNATSSNYRMPSLIAMSTAL